MTTSSAAATKGTLDSRTAGPAETASIPSRGYLLNGASLLLVCVLILLWRLPILTNDLYMPRNIYRFGSVSRGTRVRQDFQVRNLHPWPVTVTAVLGSCGCTRSVVGRDIPFRLAPLESVTIAASLDTELKRGTVLQAVSIATSDNSKGIPLYLSGNVIASRSTTDASTLSIKKELP